MRFLISLFAILILTSCAPQEIPVDVETQKVAVYVDPFSESWLSDIYACTERSSEVLVSRTTEIDSANIILQLNPSVSGEAVAYQVGDVEFRLAVNSTNPIAEIDISTIQAIYSGKRNNWAEFGGEDAPVALWAYNPEFGVEDILLEGGRLSSLAKQTQNPAAMRDIISGNPYAIGFLPADMATDADPIRFVESVEAISLPVLVLLPEEDALLRSITACLQKIN